MTDEAKALVERSVELAVNATCIADEYADVLRPKQIERLYAMRDLIETQAREIERLREALGEIKEAWDWWQVDTYDRCSSVVEDAIRAALKGTEQ